MSQKSYIDQLYELAKQKQQNAVSTAKLDYESKSQKADSEQSALRRAAYVNFMTASNPYGNTHEALAMSGLGAGGAEEKRLYNQFNAYQSALSDAYTNREKLSRELAQDLISALRKSDAESYEAAVTRAKQQMDDYWNQYAWAYKKSRDKITQNWD